MWLCNKNFCKNQDKIIYTIEKTDREDAQTADTIDKTKPAWFILVIVPRNLDSTHITMPIIDHITEVHPIAIIGIFINSISEMRNTVLAITSAVPEAVIATKDCVIVNHMDIMAHISPGMPKAFANTLRRFDKGFAQFNASASYEI